VARGRRGAQVAMHSQLSRFLVILSYLSTSYDLLLLTLLRSICQLADDCCYAVFCVTAGVPVRQGALYQWSSTESCVTGLSPGNYIDLYPFAVRKSVCFFCLLHGGPKIASFLTCVTSICDDVPRHSICQNDQF